MTKHTLSAHAALTAIAAGLVLVSTPASAQVTDTALADAAPAPDAPIVVPDAQPAPAMPGPATAVTLPPIGVPAPAPSAAAAAPMLPEIAPQRSVQAEPAPVRRAAPAEVRAIRSEARAAPVTRPAPETRTFTPAPTEPAVAPSTSAASTLPTVPLVDPAVVREEPAPAPAPAAQATEPSGTDALWVVGGTGAALLLGVGSLVFMRRRRHDAADNVAVAGAPMMSQGSDPIFATPNFAVAQPTPVSAMPADKPTSAELVLDKPVTRSPARTHTEHSDELEAMVAQAPSPENPFVTRSKRLRRAEFLLHNGHVATPTIAETPQVREESAPVKEKAPQPVYNFSSGPVSFRPKGWKPATT